MRHLGLYRRIAGLGIDLTPRWVVTLSDFLVVLIPTIHRRAKFLEVIGDDANIEIPLRSG